MDVRLINPFVLAVNEVFKTMLKTEVIRKDPKIENGMFKDPEAMTGMIGLSGMAKGVVALRFPADTALMTAARFLRKTPPAVREKVGGVLSELTNMVAGAAKAKLGFDPPLNLGLPMVVKGTDYKIEYPDKTVWLEVPMASELGGFSLIVTFSSEANR